MALGPIGIIANPASGKDIRRLVSGASVFGNQEKQAMVARAIAGAVAVGASRFCYMPDMQGIMAGVLERAAPGAQFDPIESPETESALDTIRAASQLRDRGCSVVLTLGGDGTNRAVTLGWRDAPLVPMSTGTNNVFPHAGEATLAGAAAGLIASGAIDLAEVARSSKLVIVEIEGEKDDLALIDVVLLDEQLVGAKAMWDARLFRHAILTRAEPASVGVSSIGGLLSPVSASDEQALELSFPGRSGERGPGARVVRAPIAPGLYQDVVVDEARTLPLGEAVTKLGPGMLSFDGERERRLKDGQKATMRVLREGPKVVEVERALHLAACRGLFCVS